MKYTDIAPIQRKGDKANKYNYQFLNILPIANKMYKRFMHNNVLFYYIKSLSKPSYVFHKIIDSGSD